jgi:hypothetical protein
VFRISTCRHGNERLDAAVLNVLPQRAVVAREARPSKPVACAQLSCEQEVGRQEFARNGISIDIGIFDMEFVSIMYAFLHNVTYQNIF